ncbi:Disease resistance protein [Melia azedarach]|uniref:Disease resistance protein n=1 Tax=Melia azedarach TaxID=155640 RepID=A0ACC1Y0D5_MELAZ|nr:Disease resistance protein [Melia azedarach]
MALELCTAVVSGIATKFAELLFDPIRREISYAFKYQSYVKKLRSRFEDLKSKQQRLEHDVKDAERQGDEIHDDVKQWLIKMKEFVERAEKLTDEDEDNAKNKRCFKGLCPNPMTRRYLSKEAVKAIKDATYLLAKGNFSNVSYRPAPVKTEYTNIGRGYQQFGSRMKVFQDVVEALKDPKVNMIGVYGMGGIGKTTLVKEAAKKVMEEKLFGKVVMAEVTLNPDLRTIQDKIAYDLDLTFGQHESTVYAKADRLHQRLKKERRVLVILDNIWSELKLEDVGIPLGDDEKQKKNDQGRCTILLTSRSLHVLRNDMNSQKNFSIEALSDDEAMSLFWKIVGNHSTETFDFQSLAVEIVAKCGGLPIAIKTIANALKFKSLPVWNNALNQLENSNPRQIQGMEANVYSSIKLSYDFLQSVEAKSLFRLCSLQKDGSRIPIYELITYGIGLNLFKNVYTLEQGRNEIQALIDVLRTSCLLLDGDTEDHVKMHDVVHDVAVSIARDELMLNIRNAAKLEEELENGIQNDATAICLPYIDILELPERLECPKLELFLLFTGMKQPAVVEKSLQIPDQFFEEMKQLRVLHLRKVHLPSLPSSLDCLINLRTLSLSNCHSLGDVAIVGELRKLEILSFRGSPIKMLPGEIGQLTRLKLLDLRDCLQLEVITPNVISKLSQLEELYVVNSFIRWEKGEGGSNVSVIELKALSKLTTLEIDIPDVRIVPHDLVSVELQRCNILIGVAEWAGMDSKIYETSRTLKLSGLDKTIYLANGMNILLRRTETLYLDKLNGFQNVHELDHRNSFPLLKHMVVQNSSEILHIVNSIGLLCNVFRLLESLFLSKLINLESVSHAHLTAECQSFNRLKIINVKECHKLKHLLSFSMAQKLLRLEEIEVTQCENLKMIVGRESEIHIVQENECVNFAQVHSLTLCNLPQFTSSGVDVGVSGSLSITASTSKDIIAEDDPQELMNVLFNNKVCFPVLKKLKLSSLHCIEKLWIDQFPTISTSSCQNLTKLMVFGCSRLKFLFSYSMVNGLVHLQQLVIGDCKSMEWVIEEETSSTSYSNFTVKVQKEFRMASRRVFHVFPQLTNLELWGLPKLKSINQGMHILEWLALKYFQINECHKVEMLFGSFDSKLLSQKTDSQQPVFLVDPRKVRFPNLEVLRISKMDNLRKIWNSQHDDLGSFGNLKRLDVRSCGKLMNVFPLNLIVRFERLDHLNLDFCDSIEKIIEEESSSSNCMMEGVPNRFQVLPQLTKLELLYLPKLKSIYQGAHALEWPALKHFRVIGCHEVKILFGSSKLWSSEKKSEQPIFLIDHHKVAFPNLTTLEVSYFDELRFLATFSTVKKSGETYKIGGR